MINSSLLADAIAEAKTVRQTALANARLLMKESFGDNIITEKMPMEECRYCGARKLSRDFNCPRCGGPS